jgi:hypothetical protein
MLPDTMSLMHITYITQFLQGLDFAAILLADGFER